MERFRYVPFLERYLWDQLSQEEVDNAKAAALERGEDELAAACALRALALHRKPFVLAEAEMLLGRVERRRLPQGSGAHFQRASQIALQCQRGAKVVEIVRSGLSGEALCRLIVTASLILRDAAPVGIGKRTGRFRRLALAQVAGGDSTDEDQDARGASA